MGKPTAIGLRCPASVFEVGFCSTLLEEPNDGSYIAKGGSEMGDESKVVFQMAVMRLIAGSIEVTAALLMLRFGTVATALQINGLLGLIGPVILITVSTLGILGMASQVHLSKLLVIALGVCLILLGTR